MGLTRARAWQIFDIDYKQAVRVITLTNITLSGGAPSTVDGINLAQDDRVLVAGQSTASQNGIYVVTTLGTGSNGQWTRSVDGNQTGEIQAGMIVMVTEGNIYDDTQWKLTTDDPITVGVTNLIFEQVGATLAGNFIPTANATYTLGNSTQQWKSLYVSGNTIYIGDGEITSNATGISLTSPGGAIFTVSGTSAANTIGSFGIVSATGNIIAGNVITNGLMSAVANITGGNLITGGLVSATGTITGANVTGSNLLTSGLISASGTISGGNLQTGGFISASGNITGGNIIGGANVNATTHTGTTVSVTSNITGGNLFTGGEISATGRIQGANIVGANITTVGLVSATGNITGGNITTGGLVSVIGNITGGNITTSGQVAGLSLASTNSIGEEGGELILALAAANTTLTTSVTVDIWQNRLRFFETGGTNRGAFIDLSTAAVGVGTNILSGTVPSAIVNGTTNLTAGTNGNANLTIAGTGNVVVWATTGQYTTGINSSSGNVTGANLLTSGQVSAAGNITGAYIFGNISQATGYNSSKIYNGTSEANIGTSGGNANITIGGTSNVVVFASTGAYVTGLITATGNITGGNLSGTNITGTLSTAAQTNVTSVGTLTSLNSGTISSSGTITGTTLTGTVLTGTLSTAAQTNVTSVGTLTSLNSGAISSSGTVTGTTLTGTVLTGTLSTASQPNVTSVGTLTSLNSGTISSSGTITGTTLTGTVLTGTLSTASQPNVTSVGTLTSLNSGAISSSGNVTGANLLTAGLISATGNITGGNLSLGSTGILTSGPQNITGNINVTGNVNVTGNLNYANVTDLVVGDPLIYIGANNSGNVYDLGMVVSYNDGTYQHGGWVRDASDGTWKLFGNVVDEPTTVINFANAIYQPMRSGAITATSGAFSLTLSATGNITGGNLAGTNITGTLSTAAQTNITSVGTLTSLNSGTISSSGTVTGTTLVGTVLTGTLSTAAQTNITSVGTLTSLSVTGNINAGNVIATHYGSGAGLTSIPGANVTGTVANATYATSAGSATTATSATSATSATTAGTVTTAAQGNITSVGTLTSLSVSGNINAGNVIATHYGSGAGLSSITGANITGTVANATYATSAGSATTATSATTAGTVTTAAQGNITSVGTLTSLNSGAISSSGNVTGANLVTTGLVATDSYFQLRNSGTQTGLLAKYKSILGSGTDNSTTLFSESGLGINFCTNGSATVVASISTAGTFSAIAKSFLIPHPTKPGMKLRYGSLEGPENGVYVRGRLTDSNVIELPDYWTGLVHADSLSVNLTPIGKHQRLYVEQIVDNKVYIANDGLFAGKIDCFYTVFAERKDIGKLEVEE